MKIKYCLPVIKKSKQEVLKTIKENQNEYQYFEVWLEPIKNIDNIFVNELVNILQERLILLFHRGISKSNSFSTEKKQNILDLLDGTNCFVDLDLSETQELEYLKRKKIQVKTIISYHNYEETPVDLGEVIKHMDAFKPTIYKIATMCNSQTDALKLLLLQQNLRIQNKKHIVLGMGEFGTITRVFGTLWGNELIYAPITKDEASAPGQLTKIQLKNIFYELQGTSA